MNALLTRITLVKRKRKSNPGYRKRITFAFRERASICFVEHTERGHSREHSDSGIAQRRKCKEAEYPFLSHNGVFTSNRNKHRLSFVFIFLQLLFL